MQVDLLNRVLVERVDGVSAIAADLYSLEGDDLSAALDAVTAGAPSPAVVIDGRLVCTGSVDADAVLAALAR